MTEYHQYDLPESDINVSEEVKVQPPPLYQVILKNDDYTPMEFVVEVLQHFFAMNIDQATDIMLTVHFEGQAVCGVFTAEVAEMKVVQVMMHAQKHQHPLLCVMEKQ